MRRAATALLLLVLCAPPAMAVQPGERLDDPALEARARAISQELRCLVCQNQSIDDSDAPLARDLRVLVRERLAAGDDDDAVFDFVVARYGDYVRLRPPFRADTLILWLGPAAVLLAGGAFALSVLRRRRHAADPPLSAAEEADLARILGEDERR